MSQLAPPTHRKLRATLPRQALPYVRRAASTIPRPPGRSRTRSKGRHGRSSERPTRDFVRHARSACNELMPSVRYVPRASARSWSALQHPSSRTPRKCTKHKEALGRHLLSSGDRASLPTWECTPPVSSTRPFGGVKTLRAMTPYVRLQGHLERGRPRCWAGKRGPKPEKREGTPSRKGRTRARIGAASFVPREAIHAPPPAPTHRCRQPVVCRWGRPWTTGDS